MLTQPFDSLFQIVSSQSIVVFTFSTADYILDYINFIYPGLKSVELYWIHETIC